MQELHLAHNQLDALDGLAAAEPEPPPSAAAAKGPPLTSATSWAPPHAELRSDGKKVRLALARTLTLTPTLTLTLTLPRSLSLSLSRSLTLSLTPRRPAAHAAARANTARVVARPPLPFPPSSCST